ncbi:MAG: hypothetical protein KKF00_07990 [Proteobacteria bacterium]|nr:hypothetical protein [Pseudomonadota bacterium]
MARCWTCGSSVSGYHYRCSLCKDALREIESLHETVSEGFADLARIQEQGFNQLSDQLSEISTILEWGFGELSWQLQQQTDVLRSIDHTLKTPSETKANEWRLHAEELRRRGVLEESEEFFLKALNEYRLDYRIYVGIAETYLQMSKFDNAIVLLEKSLPHAPQKEIDYKSYSYRLIGHIYACKEDYIKALDALRSSIKLSPDYADGLYDFVQYASLVSDDVIERICAQTFRQWGHNWQRAVELRDYDLICWLALSKAIKGKAVLFSLAEKERNFEQRRELVQRVLKNLLDNARGKVEVTIIMTKIDPISEEVERAISGAKSSADKFRGVDLECERIYNDAKSKLKLAKDKLTSGDYLKVLEAEKIAEESLSLFEKSKEKARSEQNYYENSFKSKLKSTFDFGEIAAASAGIGFLLGIGGCIAHLMKGYKNVDDPIGTFFSTGFTTFFIAMIGILFWRIYKLYVEKPTSKDKD